MVDEKTGNSEKNLKKSEKNNEDYSSEHIKVFENLEAVRKRPSMYIGSTSSRGLHHLVYEIVDNSIDEAMAEYCDKIDVIVHNDNSVTVKDNGRGIPVDIHSQYNISGVQVVLTKLHAGGKFDKKSYKVSGGLHGVGASVVNALSEFLEVRVKRKGQIWYQKYEKGKPLAELKVIDSTEDTGTEVHFKPDSEIFNTISFDITILQSRLRELAFLNAIKITLKDERPKKPMETEFYYENGVIDFVKYLNKNKTPIHDIIYLKKEKKGVQLEVAMQYTETYSESLFSFVNNINTHEGGTHLTGFKTALTRTLNNYMESNKIADKERFISDDVREGLSCIIALKIPEPQFEGQTKTKLGNREIKGVVDSLVSNGLNVFLDEHPKTAKIILNKSLNALKTREAARKAKEITRRKNVLEFSTLPGKLADCSNKDPARCEIFIVEGDSAGGSAKQARKRDFQAILPLRGKILNVEKARLNKILANTEIGNMITALGTGIGDDFDLNKLRYSTIIIMTDSDVDGAHIDTLLLTFFFRYMTPLIETGHIFLAQPPLYLVKRGKEKYYVRGDNEKEEIMKKMGTKNISVQRFKGLGEMNPPQLWETTMDPEKRVLKRITIDDALAADEIFTILMGKEVEPRRNFIEEHAEKVINLDI